MADDKLRVLLSLCAWRDVTMRTATAWTMSVASLAQKYALQVSPWCGDALISRARSIMISKFLDQTDAEILVWVDSDITWRITPENDLERLIQSAAQTRGIVGGAYSVRKFGGGITFRLRSATEFATDTDQLLDAETVSTGFIACHREGLEAIARKLPYVVDVNGSYQPFCLPGLAEYDKGLRYLSEDWALCYRAHDAGVTVHLDAKPVLGHEGSHVFTVQDGMKR